MECRYKVTYIESEKIYADMYKLHKVRENNMTVLAVPACITVIAFYVCYAAGFMTGQQGSVPVFWVKFILAIAALFGVGQFYRVKWGKSSSVAVAEREGQEMFAKRRRFGKITVTVEFFDDYFSSYANMTKVSKGEKIEDSRYSYAEVRQLFETEDIFGMTVITEYMQKRLICVPKSALKKEEIDKFRDWLIEKCIGVKKGMIKIEF